MSRLLVAAAITLLASACGGGSAPTAEDLAPSVARVSGTACNRTVEGSAALIAEGLYLTNAHVIAGVEEDLQLRIGGGGDFPGTVVGFDPDRDLALVAAQGVTGSPFSIGSAEAGDSGAIAAVTTDLDVEMIDYEVRRRIRATGDDIYGEGDVSREALEVAADIGSGVSGAALVNGDGELVGVVFAESQTKDSTYAVYSTEIEAFLSEVDTSSEVGAGRCL